MASGDRLNLDVLRTALDLLWLYGEPGQAPVSFHRFVVLRAGQAAPLAIADRTQARLKRVPRSGA